MGKIKNKKGFTVTEFVILSAMLMILGLALSYEVMNAVDTARQKKSIMNMREWATALSAYYSDYNFYPNDPANPNVPVGPGELVYEALRMNRYLDKPIYTDGWYNNLWYLASSSMPQVYTIASLGKGNLWDMTVPNFKCFQCDIRMKNGEFFTYPVGHQEDNPDGSESCPTAVGICN